jgi:DNA-binding PadR family transcriptional regulator
MNRGAGLLTRLLALWLLSEQPQHGYGIRQGLTGLELWFPIEDASIYSILRSLQASGLIRELGTEKNGKRPTRTRYSITPAGRAEYHSQLAQALEKLEPPDGLISLALMANADLADDIFLAGLEARALALEQKLLAIADQARASPSRLMVEREMAMTRAELEWCKNLIAEKRRES